MTPIPQSLGGNSSSDIEPDAPQNSMNSSGVSAMLAFPKLAEGSWVPEEPNSIGEFSTWHSQTITATGWFLKKAKNRGKTKRR